MKSLIVDSGSLYHSYISQEALSDRSPQRVTAKAIQWLDGKIDSENAHNIYVLGEFDTESLQEKSADDLSYFNLCIYHWTQKNNAFFIQISNNNRTIDVVGGLIDEFDSTSIATCDLRMAQFLSQNVQVLQPTNDHPYTHNDLYNELNGLSPQKIPLFLALIGHDTTGTPPIAGSNNSLELILASDADISSVISNSKTRSGYDYTNISRAEKRIRDNLKNTISRSSGIRNEYLKRVWNPDSAAALKQLILKEAIEPKSINLPNIAVSVTQVLQQDHLEELKSLMVGSKAYGLIVEKDNTGIYALTLSFKDGAAHYLPLHTKNGQTVDNISLTNQMKDAIENSNALVTFSAYELAVDFIELGFPVNKIVADCASAKYLLNSLDSLQDISDLHVVSGEVLPTMDSFLSKEGRGLAQNAGIDKCSVFSGIRADIAWKASKSIFRQISAENLKEQYVKFEIPQALACAVMARRGIQINMKSIDDTQRKLNVRLDSILSDISNILGTEEFIPDEASVIQALKSLNLKTKSATKSGFSVNKEALQDISNSHPIIPLIIHARSIKTQLDGIKTVSEHVNQQTSLLTYKVNVNKTLTSRLSTIDPNVQGFTDEMRDFATAREGYVFVGFDISQMELRILAELSGEENLIEAFKNGRDIHAQTAGEVFGVDPNNVSENQRKAAKAINFGLVYGISAFGLAKKLDVSPATAEKYIDTYFEKHPKVKAYKEKTLSNAHKKGFVELINGRKIYFPEINSSDKAMMSAAERSAGNSPMQGSAGEYVKRAMILCNKTIGEKKMDAHLVLQVHDELIFEVPAAPLEQKRCVEALRLCVENAMKLSIPVVVDHFIGTTMSKKAHKDNNLALSQGLTI